MGGRKVWSPPRLPCGLEQGFQAQLALRRTWPGTGCTCQHSGPSQAGAQGPRHSTEMSAGLQPTTWDKRDRPAGEPRPGPGRRRAAGAARSCLRLAEPEDTHPTFHSASRGTRSRCCPCPRHAVAAGAKPGRRLARRRPRSAARLSVWEAPLKTMGGASAVHVQVHNKAGQPLGSAASAGQHPRPGRPPPARPLTARLPRRGLAAGSPGGPLSVAMHWLLARVVISRLFGVSIRQLQRHLLEAVRLSRQDRWPALQSQQTRGVLLPPPPAQMLRYTWVTRLTGSLRNTLTRRHTGSPGQDSTPPRERPCLPCSVSELRPHVSAWST